MTVLPRHTLLHVLKVLVALIGGCNLLAFALVIAPNGSKDGGLPDWYRNATGDPPEDEDPDMDCSHRQPGGCRVLVFGDSWGSLGPGYHMVEEIFAKHGVPVTVKSAAISGTRACQWAQHPDALTKAAWKLFGPNKIDFVWFTLGGNDLLMPGGLKEEDGCSHGVDSWEEALRCLSVKNDMIIGCNEKLLSHFWKYYRHTKVVQCGYDSTCAAEACLDGTSLRSGGFCGSSNSSCMIDFFQRWQDLLLRPLEKYNTDPNEPLYTGINVMGAMQHLSGVPGARPGHPIVNGKPPDCDWFETCIHPMADSPASELIGEAFWNLFFKKWVTPAVDPYLPPQHDVHIPRRGMFDDELAQTRCIWDWVPSIDSPIPPKGCEIADLKIDGAAWPPVA